MRVRLNHIIKSYSEFAVLEDVCLSFDSPSFNIVTGNATGRGNWRARPPRAMACGAWRRTIRTRCRRPAWKAASLRPRIWKRRTLWSSASWCSLSYGGFRFRRMDEGKPPSFRAPSPAEISLFAGATAICGQAIMPSLPPVKPNPNHRPCAD